MSDFLYHYTSVDSLASILQGRTIKFSPLTTVDDYQEEKVKDNQRYGKYVFISSWTEDVSESIPMWNLYSDLSRGVRIKLPRCPFKEYPIDQQRLEGMNIKIDPNFVFFKPTSEVFSKPYIMFPSCEKSQEAFLYKVDYIKDKELLEPQIKIQNGNEVNIALGKLGKYKNTYWDFQKEWRYIFVFYPISYYECTNPTDLLVHRFNTGIDLPFNYFFMEISDEAFSQMEITLSPKISDGNRIIIDLLKEKYNKDIKICESDLFGTLR